MPKVKKNTIKNLQDRLKEHVYRTINKSFEIFAPEALEIVAKHEPRYNNYSGRLNHAYYSAVFSKNRKGTKKFKLFATRDEVTYWGRAKQRTLKNGKKGAFVFYCINKRHGYKKNKKVTYRRKRVNGRYYFTTRKRDVALSEKEIFRYVKKGESKVGTEHDNDRRAMTKVGRRFSSVNKKNDAITIFNSAPYSDAVQKRYNVLSNNVKNEIQKKALTSIKAQMKKAGF